jgi:PAS domain S-box-containing protein
MAHEPDSASGADRALAADETLRAIFQCDIVGLVVVDIESRTVLEASPGFLAAVGLARDECIRARFDALGIIEPGLYSKMREEFLSTGKLSARRLHLHTKNKASRFVTITASLVKIGEANCMLGFVVDETERALFESLAEAMFSGMQMGVAMFDLEMRPYAINAAAIADLGLSREEFLSRGFSDLPFEAEGSDRAPWIEAAATDGPVRRDGRCPRTDKWFSVHAEPVRAMGTGETLGVFVTFHDISDLKQATAELQAALEAKGVLMREVQHRIKNNLAMLSSMMGIALARTVSDEAKRELSKTRDRIAAMGKLYDFVYRSGAQAGDIDLAAYLEEMTRNIAVAYDLSGIEFSREFGRCALDLKRATAVGLVFMELVVNAIRYAYPEGSGGSIRTSLLEEDGWVTLRVDDDGCGASSREGRDPASTGTGRLICEALAQDLDGSLSIEEGDGTRCALRFPL